MLLCRSLFTCAKRTTCYRTDCAWKQMHRVFLSALDFREPFWDHHVHWNLALGWEPFLFVVKKKSSLWSLRATKEWTLKFVGPSAVLCRASQLRQHWCYLIFFQVLLLFLPASSWNTYWKHNYRTWSGLSWFVRRPSASCVSCSGVTVQWISSMNLKWS